MFKQYFKASSINDINVDTKAYEYYVVKDKNKLNLGTIGPIIRNVDVGLVRYEDTHSFYPIIDLSTKDLLIQDIKFDGYFARCYCPKDIKGLRPTIFFVHGGGFASGNVEKYNMPMKRLTELLDGVVISIEYSLSPEAAYPTALEQCYHVIETILKENEKYNIDLEKVAIAGDSAGGNLAAALCLKDKENKYIKMQILYYPELDFTHKFKNNLTAKHFGDNVDSFIWKRIQNMTSMFDTWDVAYLQNNEDRTNELVSPFFAKNYNDFPRTIIICAQYDFFTLESSEFAEKLDKAGVKTDFYCYENCFHGFLEKLGTLEQSDKSLKLVAKLVSDFNLK